MWINRQGKEETINAPPRSYAAARISPDGIRVALEIRDQEYNIWIWDLARQTLTRLTDGHSVDSSPVWTADSSRIIFMSAPDGFGNLYWQAANKTGPVERLTMSLHLPQAPTSISPDGSRLVFTEGTPNSSADILMMTMDGKRPTEPLIQNTKYRQLNAEISPNGHWIAYESNESGTNQVYVRPFPKVDGGHEQVSTGPVGTRPLWARNGRELFYAAANRLMVVPVQTGGQTFRAGNPAKVFDYPLVIPGLPGRSFDISPDGQRFLVIKDATNDQSSTATPASMVVVLNWLEELKQRVPVH
jgi:serine/threonine-protein kinase